MRRAGVSALLLLGLVRMACGQEAQPQDAGGQPPGQEPDAPLPGQQPGEAAPPPARPPVNLGSFAPFASVGAVYSDNLSHATTNTTTGTAMNAVAGLHVRRSGDLTVNADLSGQYREYVGVNLPGQFLPSVNGSASYMAIPERLYISAQDTLGQISTQAFDALSDTTRQNSNFLTVGPELLLPFTSRDTLTTELQYGRSSYSNSNISNNRYIGNLSLARLVGTQSFVSANYRYQQVDYDHSDIYPKVTNSTAFLRFNAEGARTYLAVEAGREMVKIGAQTIDLTVTGTTTETVQTRVPPGEHSAPHFLLALQRRLSPLMSITTEYTHTVSDASETVRQSAQNGLNAGNTLNVQSTAEPFVQDGAYVMLLRAAPLGTIAFQGTWERERYEQDALLNRKQVGADLILDRRLAPQWTLAGTARWQNGKYDNTGVRDNRLLFSLGLTRQLSRSLQAALVYERNHGTGQESLVGSTLAVTNATYTENRVTLLLHYSPQVVASQVFDPVNQFRFYQRPDRQATSQPLSGDPNTQ